jgi:predicted nucleic acid-binding protein
MKRVESKRVVLADAGPLIALARIGHLQLLPGLFGEVSITQQVAAELIGGGSFPDSAELHKALAQARLKTVALEPGPELAAATLLTAWHCAAT